MASYNKKYCLSIRLYREHRVFRSISYFFLLLTVLLTSFACANETLLENERFIKVLQDAVGTNVSNPNIEKLNGYLYKTNSASNFGNLSGVDVAVAIIPDPGLTISFNGSQLPIAFKVGIKNTGNTADTFSLNPITIPVGFTLKTSLPNVEIPAGEIAEIGVYLLPISGVPAPGTTVSFGLNITSTTNPSVTANTTQNLIVPDIHGIAITSNPSTLNTTPGQATPAILTLKSVGNVAENVTLTASTPAGLALDGLAPRSLNSGESINLPISLTPAANTPLNSTLTATISADFGTSKSQALVIPVFVAAPGAKGIADASTAASQLNKPDLANRLNDLSRAMNTLVQNPADPVAKSQALAALDSISQQITADAVLSHFADAFITAQNALEAAHTPSEIQTALNGLGTALNSFGSTITQLQQHNFEAFLSPSSLEAQPSIAAGFAVRIRNTGSEATTYNLSLDSLPANTTGAFNQSSVTLQPGELSSGITASLTRTASNELLPASFKVKIALNSAHEVFRLIDGNLTVRNEFVSVASVASTPLFADPAVNPPVQMAISAKILNAVNRARNAKVSFRVKNSTDQVVFSSAPVNTALSVQTSLTDVALGNFNPQGFPVGSYIVEVSLTDENNIPIPGGSGTGTLFLGLPLTATLANTPASLPPGEGSVSNTLAINSKLLLPPLSVVGQQVIPGNGAQNGVAVKNTIAYVCGSTGINLFDVTNPALPTLIRTIGSGVNVGCKINGNLLLSLEQSANERARLLHVYSLQSDPANPLLLGTSPLINYGNQIDLISDGKSAFIAQLTFCSVIGPNDIYTQLGDVLSVPLNLNNAVNPTAASPALSDVLYNTHGDQSFDPHDVSGCAENGGDNNVWQLAFADANTLLIATTTVTGTDTQTGVGRVLVIDITDPANISIVKEVQIPGTKHAMGIAVDGNRALVASSTGGWRDFFSSSDPNNDPLLLGNLVFSTLDLTDPRNPVLLASQSVNRQSHTFWSSMTALGNNRYVFSNLGGISETPEIVMLDASDPFNLAIGQTTIPKELIGPNALTGAGDLIYTTSASGLIIYTLPALPVIPVTASVKVPKNTGLETRNFNVTPDNVVSSNNFDTLEWNFNLTAGSSRLLNWETLVHNLQPGELRQTTLGGTIAFTYASTPGQLPLNPTAVVSQQILSIAPATATVQPGAVARYQLTVKNPTAGPVNYPLAVQGIPASWVQLTSPVALDAFTEQTLNLDVNVPSFATLGTRNLVVTVHADSGAQGSVQADLILAGEPVVSPVDANAHGVVIALTPAAATAGQGTTARYTVQLTNTGNSTETFVLSAALLPVNVNAVFDSPSITIPPGASNFRQVGLSLTPAAGTPANDYPFSVQAKFNTNNQIASTAQGLLTVVNAGIALSFAQNTGNSGDTLGLRVTNTGSIEDDFDLVLGGPGALSSNLLKSRALLSKALNNTPPSLSVHLPAGGTTVINVVLGEVDFALPGQVNLFARATSRYDSAVTTVADAGIVSEQRHSLDVVIEPSVVNLLAPGKADFVIKVNNLGNIEDAYSAVISNVNGPIAASLQGLDGKPTQRIPVFRLPALATGALALTTQLNQAGTGTVKVVISSSTSSAITKEVIARVNFVQNDAPISGGTNSNPEVNNAPISGVTDSNSDVDSDGDGVSDKIENLVPGTRDTKGSINKGDGNGDSVLDSYQGAVTSLPLIKADSGQNASRYVTFAILDASKTALFRQIKQSILTGTNAAPEQGYLNFGNINFNVTGLEIGKLINIRAYFAPEKLINGFWMQQADKSWTQLGADSLKVEAGKAQLTWQFTEGGEFDSDGLSNGVVTSANTGGLGFGRGTNNADRDADGVADALEPVLGMIVGLKDNDVTRNERFLAQLYRDLYYREIAADEIQAQLIALTANGKRVDRIINLALAEEFERYHISTAVRLFLAFNGRAASRQEIDLWRTLLKNDSSLLEVLDYFMRSSALGNVYQLGTDPDYLHALEIPILHRLLSTAELQEFANYMQQIGRVEFTSLALGVPAFAQTYNADLIVNLIADLLLDYPLDNITLKYYSDALVAGSTTPPDLVAWVLQLGLYDNRFLSNH